MADLDPPAGITSPKHEVSPEQITFSEGRPKWVKCLIALVVVAFIVAAVFLVLFLVFYFRSEDKEKKDDICNTVQCLQTAASISEGLDSSVDPCEDFYRFACGKWNDNNPMPRSAQKWGPLDIVRHNTHTALRDLLETADPSAPVAIQKLRGFYKSCLLPGDIGKLSLIQLIRAGGPNTFPTLDGPNWVDKDWSLNQILQRVPRFPDFTDVAYQEFTPLISMQLQMDYYQAGKPIIMFKQTPITDGARSKFLGERQGVSAYEMVYQLLATALGADPVIAAQDAKDVVDFEVLVAKATSSPVELLDRKKSFTKMTLRNVTERFPEFDWLGYLQRQFSPVGINITLDEVVALQPMEYFEKIFPVLNTTSRRTVLNYCMWKLMVGYSSVAIKEYFQLLKMERWQTCVTLSQQLFPQATGRLFVDRHFSRSQRTKVDNMIDDLKEAFRDIVRETDWMSAQTKEAAYDKLDAMVELIGYPDDLKNDTYLNEENNDVVINETDVVTNAANIGAHITHHMYSLHRTTISRRMWPVSASVTNAFNSIQTNAIVFPAGILQKPLFKKNDLDILTYGGLGFFIGHEITHGFDNTGATFDKEGALRDWWHPQDVQRFQERADCMAEQYSAYTFPEVNMSVDGRLTLGENIADNGALKEAYKAYKRLMAKKGQGDTKLPVLSYTPDQLFFIGMAQFWCGNYRIEALPRVLADTHSPDRVRVIGTTQNSQEFAQAFNCPAGSYMNPEKKCHVW